LHLAKNRGGNIPNSHDLKKGGRLTKKDEGTAKRESAVAYRVRKLVRNYGISNREATRTTEEGGKIRTPGKNPRKENISPEK